MIDTINEFDRRDIKKAYSSMYLKTQINESTKGFVKKLSNGCKLHDMGDIFVVTDKNGKNIGQCRTEIEADDIASKEGCSSVSEFTQNTNEDSLEKDYVDAGGNEDDFDIPEPVHHKVIFKKWYYPDYMIKDNPTLHEGDFEVTAWFPEDSVVFDATCGHGDCDNDIVSKWPDASEDEYHDLLDKMRKNIYLEKEGDFIDVQQSENESADKKMKVFYIADQDGEPLDYLEGLENGYYATRELAEKAMEKWLKDNDAYNRDDFYFSIKSVTDTVNPKDVIGYSDTNENSLEKDYVDAGGDEDDFDIPEREPSNDDIKTQWDEFITRRQSENPGFEPCINVKDGGVVYINYNPENNKLEYGEEAGGKIAVAGAVNYDKDYSMEVNLRMAVEEIVDKYGTYGD